MKRVEATGALCLLLAVCVWLGVGSNAASVVYGGVPNDPSLATAWANGRLLNQTLNSLRPGDKFIIPPRRFHTMGGIVGSNLTDVTISIDGTLIFSNNQKEWPRHADGRVLECFALLSPVNVTVTSIGQGLLDGQGAGWWGIPFIGYLEIGENRPRLFYIGQGKDLLVERIFLLNSPYWTFFAEGVDGLEVRDSHVSARRDDDDGHDLDDLSAFNTDGFDVSGRNVWIHDCSVWNQDDCFCVKDDSENMLFERITASGLGLTIGSIGNSTVRNITFRDCYMDHTVKGIYVKFRADGGLIEDVVYENIVMNAPEQWPIWIGPAQQSDTSDLCAAHPCSLCWPSIPFASCNPVANGTFRNILLRNITINNPASYPGVILGSQANQMEGLVFDSVVVNGAPAGEEDYFRCEGVAKGKATGSTRPVPKCFEDQTDHRSPLSKLAE